MSTRWCPACHAEYREGFVVCGDCGVALVDALPAPPALRHTRRPKQPVTPFLPGDDVVELARLGTIEAELVAAQLRDAGIPAAVFGTGPGIYTGVRLARLMVRRSDLTDAGQFLAEVSAADRSGPPIADDDLAVLAEESTDTCDPASGAAI